MAKNKIMFTAEVNKLTQLRDALGMSTKLNGTQVILGDTNKQKLKEAVDLIQQARNKLSEIS